MTAHRKWGHGYPRQLLICDKWNPGNATGVGIVCPSGRPANYGVASNKLQPKTPTRFVHRRINNSAASSSPRSGKRQGPLRPRLDREASKQLGPFVCMCIVCVRVRNMRGILFPNICARCFVVGCFNSGLTATDPSTN